jgi:hypothetical protein
MDVTNTVDISDPVMVAAEVRRVLEALYPDHDFAVVDTLFADVASLYRGEWPGYGACDVEYHDLQHVLDVTLAMARLIDGYERSAGTAPPLGAELALTGIACALFHDSGYIRRERDRRFHNGGAYTRIHVTRSARIMTDYLPSIGLAKAVPVCRRIVHFTGYEVNPRSIRVNSDAERELGSLLGTADLIAQMADARYLEKCRDHLYREFEAGGMAGPDGRPGVTGILYRSPRHLLEATPGFIRNAIEVRLNGYFRRAYRHVDTHFGGRNPYMDAVRANRERLDEWLARDDADPDQL